METILKYFSDFTLRQLQQFEALKDLYKEWNEKINIISRKDIDSLFERHVLHSLSIAASFEFEPGSEIMDLGTGGGFPGIPLAIFFPELKFHLVDSIAKKLKVVNAIAESIELTNITTQHSRVEDIKNSPQNPSRKFDFVVSRAVAPLKDLWKWSKPLLKSQKSEPVNYPDGSWKATHRLTHDLRFTAHQSTPPQPGLICLKGGDLALEIKESNTRPRLMEIKEIFDEEFFRDKYILYVTR
ncbi:MAG: 16S rRNA (guanine(527)-N(7))-methyltransferase RsmG [Chitinophagaceae bacterium]